MTTPYDKLVANTPAEVLAAFEDSYRHPMFENGCCNRCGNYVGDFEFHLAWHKSTAQQRWVLSWQLDVIRFVEGQGPPKT